ncbi:MAG: outer membrane lipoprotein-sorting protein [Spirochaetia bacterium]
MTLLTGAETVLYPDTFRMVASMDTRKPDGKDSRMRLEVYHHDEKGTFMEILSPARSRGTRFLQKDEDLWMYIPKSNSQRAIRLSPKESFQNSVFSNSDVSDLHYSDDYTARFGDPETISHPDLGETDTTVIIAEAKHGKAPYGKIVIWLRKSDNMPLRMEYYSKSGILFKRMILTDFKQMAEKHRPSTMKMTSMVQDGAFTVMNIEEMELLNTVNDRYFNLSYLTR